MSTAELTIVVISYNTREMTLACLRSVYAQTQDVRFEVVVFDNASADGSADAVAAAFPEARLIRSAENIGFARANNAVAREVGTEWLLLLNPDTEIRDRAIDRLVAFAQSRPENGVYGGRTVFPDGSLNIASCWNRITPWSAFCRATGLTALFRRTALFDPEAIGSWPRDTVREVDIVVGCFLLIPTELWRDLGGFDETYWMYGEEADLCLRAARLGWRPIVTPEATIMHVVGASTGDRPAAKIIHMTTARTTLMRRHWPAAWRPFGIALTWVWGASRTAAAMALGVLDGRHAARRETWAAVWKARDRWLRGYG